VTFTGEHKDVFGVEPVCRVLAQYGLPDRTKHLLRGQVPAALGTGRARRAAKSRDHPRVEGELRGLRADKVWLELGRQGIAVARCTVERLMRELGIHGARRGRKIRTTVRDERRDRAGDLLKRDFTAPAPDRRWVAGLERRRAQARQAGARRPADGAVAAAPGRPPAGPGLVHHSDAGSQYTSFAFTAHLLGAGIDASIGIVGDAYDNALMESTIGLYKTELIKPCGPWRSLADIELATAEYVDWYNTKRLHTAIGGIPPAEHEAAYYAKNQPQPVAGSKS
jgi:putative transposase